MTPLEENSNVVNSTRKPSIEPPTKFDAEPITLESVMNMIDDFKNQTHYLDVDEAKQIIIETEKLLVLLPSLVHVTIPHGKNITVCGDIHGQFYDLINIFEINGFPSDDNIYLFNGDFVDRGNYSVEVILTLFAFKCLYPENVYLARGNHETRAMNHVHGFKREVNTKLSCKFVGLFNRVFCRLPLAHVINNKVFVVHGGLFSRDGVKLSDIRGINRFCEPGQSGLMCEMLWSDPSPGKGRGPSPRGIGVGFGSDVTKKFLGDNGLDLIVRSHELKDEGYEIGHDGKLITIFSAPNYCNRFGNKGAFIRFTAPEFKLDNIVQFSAVPFRKM